MLLQMHLHVESIYEPFHQDPWVTMKLEQAQLLTFPAWRFELLTPNCWHKNLGLQN